MIIYLLLSIYLVFYIPTVVMCNDYVNWYFKTIGLLFLFGALAILAINVDYTLHKSEMYSSLAMFGMSLFINIVPAVIKKNKANG
jgi:hypothetical protein